MIPEKHSTAAQSGRSTSAQQLGLLLLRLGMAALLWRYHVSHKLQHFSTELREFPDPLGIGHAASLISALSTEALCSLSIAIGFATRLACLPLLFTMLMVVILGARGLEGSDVQAAWLYALPYATLMLTGPGQYSLDAVFAPYYARTRQHVWPHARTEAS